MLRILREIIYEGGVESTADMLESEHAERTAPKSWREELRALEALRPVEKESRPGNGCIECHRQQHGFCTLSDDTRDVKPWVQAGKEPGSPQVVPDWCPLMKGGGR